MFAAEGPTGPTGTLAASAYGGLFAATPSDMLLTGSTMNLLTNLNGQRPADNIVYGPNAMTVERGGVYLVSYAVSYAYDETADLRFSVSINGGYLGGTLAENHNEAGSGIHSVSRGALVELTAGDVLRLSVTPVVTGGLLVLPPFGTELYLVQIA